MPKFAFCILSLLPSVALSYHTHVLFTNRASPAVRRALTPTLRGVNPNSPEEDADARARLERMFAAEPAPEQFVAGGAAAEAVAADEAGALAEASEIGACGRQPARVPSDQSHSNRPG